jgi:hypothetical protein
VVPAGPSSSCSAAAAPAAAVAAADVVALGAPAAASSREFRGRVQRPPMPQDIHSVPLSESAFHFRVRTVLVHKFCVCLCASVGCFCLLTGLLAYLSSICRRLCMAACSDSMCVHVTCMYVSVCMHVCMYGMRACVCSCVCSNGPVVSTPGRNCPAPQYAQGVPHSGYGRVRLVRLLRHVSQWNAMLRTGGRISCSAWLLFRDARVGWHEGSTLVCPVACKHFALRPEFFFARIGRPAP